MKFTNCIHLNYRFFWRISLLMSVGLFILLSGCSSSPKKPKTTDAGVVVPGVSILPAGPATPNPYLQNRPSLSRPILQKFNDATKAMRNKQWAQAEALLQAIVAENNKLSGAYVNLALVYVGQKDNKKAEKAFSDAIIANPNNLDAYNQFAVFQREQGNFAGAEANYKKALGIWPFHPDSHKNIAILYELYMGKNAEALPHYEAYLQLKGGSDKEIESWIADLQRRLGIAPKPKAKPAAPLTEESATEKTEAVQ
jgi:Tfp pilus assembly protein PilF